MRQIADRSDVAYVLHNSAAQPTLEGPFSPESVGDHRRTQKLRPFQVRPPSAASTLNSLRTEKMPFMMMTAVLFLALFQSISAVPAPFTGFPETDINSGKKPGHYAPGTVPGSSGIQPTTSYPQTDYTPFIDNVNGGKKPGYYAPGTVPGSSGIQPTISYPQTDYTPFIDNVNGGKKPGYYAPGTVPGSSGIQPTISYPQTDYTPFIDNVNGGKKPGHYAPGTVPGSSGIQPMISYPQTDSTPFIDNVNGGKKPGYYAPGTVPGSSGVQPSISHPPYNQPTRLYNSPDFATLYAAYLRSLYGGSLLGTGSTTPGSFGYSDPRGLLSAKGEEASIDDNKH
ncbi:hypothetical protein PTTG_25430 [Puccinia triticina 1-1 BBBD Race 1]|uniref:Uncharacterized protein n=1 Tax=Puccinia triticina (isolate 1-1 / race 1 (BBBD)) TaxID=630390 RepID=A0A180H3B9_PUCT1|nr:hypothetical protein PTTG_25430 [Puccinia triticina 1-1 BBBD Race 1]